MLTNILLMLIGFSGIILGIIIGRHTYEELKSGEKYFIFFKGVILFSMSLILIFGIKRFSLDLLFLLLLGFAIAHFLKFTYFFLGISAAASILTNQQLLILPLVYVYGLPFGTIRYYHIKNHRKLLKIIIVNLILFMFPLLFLFFDFNAYMLAAFSAGTLIANIR